MSSALSRKALRSFLRCSMAREVGPVGHLSTCPVLGTAARLCSGLSRGYFPALASFLYSLCGISQGYFLPADFFYVSTVSCILSQILLPTMQSRDHCTHLTDERLGLCRFRGMASIHTGGKCWWQSRNQPPDPKPLDSLPSLSVHDPHPLVRPVFLVSLSKTARRKGPHGETHRIPSGMKFMLKRQVKLPGEEQRKVCLWKLSPS